VRQSPFRVEVQGGAPIALPDGQLGRRGEHLKDLLALVLLGLFGPLPLGVCPVKFLGHRLLSLFSPRSRRRREDQCHEE
jgi:hypothetical protein